MARRAGGDVRTLRQGSVAVGAAVLLVLAACGNDSDAADEAAGTTATSETAPDGDRSTTETTAATGDGDAAETLRIHVTNDDGVDAPGLDSLVEALHTLDDVEIVVVTPLEDHSGSGDTRSDELPEASEETTASGRDALAVHGLPADSVAWAHAELFAGDEEPPHLTVAGNNSGQNHGWIAPLSGTVGAAREAARHGVPALAVSQQLADGGPDFEAAVPFVLDWIEDQRDALLAGEVGLDTVASLNVPTCAEGEVRGLVETTRDPREQGEDDLDAFAPADCTSTEDPADRSDVEALQIGFATLTPIPVEIE